MAPLCILADGAAPPHRALELGAARSDPTVRPLGKLLVAKSYSTRVGEKTTKTDAVKHVPVHPRSPRCSPSGSSTPRPFTARVWPSSVATARPLPIAHTLRERISGQRAWPWFWRRRRGYKGSPAGRVRRNARVNAAADAHAYLVQASERLSPTMSLMPRIASIGHRSWDAR